MPRKVVTVSDTVMAKPKGDRLPPVRWVVSATFVDADGAEPRCVDYRVRVVPEGNATESLRAAHRIIREMEAGAISADAASALGAIPAEGIPRRVFEVASQARLLAKARSLVERKPGRFEPETGELLRPRQRPLGRPPARSLADKLVILADSEAAFSTPGVTRADVAHRNAMSESSLRDLLSWACHVSKPPLWVTPGPGRRGGYLTTAAKALLAQIATEGEHDGER